jgi:hypothetical protein
MLHPTGPRSGGLLATLLLLAATVLFPPPVAADERVDLELVLAVDVSGSMDRDEQQLQRAGYVAALTHPDVLAAVSAGLTGRIALTYMEWAGPSAQRVAVPWQVIDGEASARDFAAKIAAAPLGTMRGTSISSGLRLAATLFEANGFTGYRKVIDMSGDGPNNMGPPVIEARDTVVALGIVINGLPIMLKQANSAGFGSISDLDTYYANCVIGGPGAFLVSVNAPSGLVDAIRRKMILEIADAGDDGAALRLVAAEPVTDPNYDCMIGERLRRQWMDR